MIQVAHGVNTLCDAMLSLPEGVDLAGVELRSNEPLWDEVLYWQRGDSLAFRSKRGWMGHIELED